MILFLYFFVTCTCTCILFLFLFFFGRTHAHTSRIMKGFVIIFCHCSVVLYTYYYVLTLIYSSSWQIIATPAKTHLLLTGKLYTHSRDTHIIFLLSHGSIVRRKKSKLFNKRFLSYFCPAAAASRCYEGWLLTTTTTTTTCRGKSWPTRHVTPAQTTKLALQLLQLLKKRQSVLKIVFMDCPYLVIYCFFQWSAHWCVRSRIDQLQVTHVHVSLYAEWYVYMFYDSLFVSYTLSLFFLVSCLVFLSSHLPMTSAHKRYISDSCIWGCHYCYTVWRCCFGFGLAWSRWS